MFKLSSDTYLFVVGFVALLKNLTIIHCYLKHKPIVNLYIYVASIYWSFCSLCIILIVNS